MILRQLLAAATRGGPAVQHRVDFAFCRNSKMRT